MAYNTIEPLANTNITADIITVADEKNFLLKDIFYNDLNKYNSSNIYFRIYDDIQNESQIPLTSVIYTPSRWYFENSKFYKNINNTKVLQWLRKRNTLVLIYGITSQLDYNNQEHKLSENLIYNDLIETSGCGFTTSAHHQTTSSISTLFDMQQDDNNDILTLYRFENSPFNFRLNLIKSRVCNIYSCNYTPINYLIFNDLNSNECFTKFMNNTINISLI